MAEILNDLIEDEGTSLEELETTEEVEEVVENKTEEISVVEKHIPEKFRGKSVEDIAESYVNLEREYGKRAQEIGELRKLTDQILHQQIVNTRQEPKEEEKVEETDFFVDPTSAVNKAITNHPKIKEFEEAKEVAVKQRNKERFEEKHSDYEEILKEEDFQKWIVASPIRQRLFAQANNNFDFEAGDEIFSQYKEIKTLRNGAKQQMKDNQTASLSAASVPSGNSSAESSKKVFRRADLIRLKMTDPQRYDDLSDEIMKAYSEGRVK